MEGHPGLFFQAAKAVKANVGKKAFLCCECVIGFCGVFNIRWFSGEWFKRFVATPRVINRAFTYDDDI